MVGNNVPAIRDSSGTLEVVDSCDTADKNPLRVLHVEDDAIDAMCVDRNLRGELPIGSKLDHVDSLESALRKLEEQVYDAILLDLALPDSVGLDTLRAVARRHNATPILVLTGDEHPAMVFQALREGAHDFLFKSRLDGRFLAEALRRVLLEDRRSDSSDTARISVPGRQHVERRASPRYLLSASAVLFPINTDGSPGEAVVASVVDITGIGIGVMAEQDMENSDLCLVGVERADGSYAYITVRWKRGGSRQDGRRWGGTFVTGHDDPLEKSKLTPRLNTTTLKLEPTIRESILRQWALRGVARPYSIDKLMVCPSCQAIPTFREGCPKCGAAQMATHRLIHHFACAHVAQAADFEIDEVLICPKCRARNLIVGADFEHLNGPKRCLDCSWSGGEAILIGECLRCGLRFPGSAASNEEVIEFHVERLDPLGVIEAR